MARERAVQAIQNIANCDAKVKNGLLHFPRLMRIDAIIGDVTLNGTVTKKLAKRVKEKVKQPESDARGSRTLPTLSLQVPILIDFFTKRSWLRCAPPL
jgi:hypothetical protein